jgi:hypothetical protein
MNAVAPENPLGPSLSEEQAREIYAQVEEADACPDCGGPLNCCSETRTRYVEEILYPWYEQIQQEALDSGGCTPTKAAGG